MTGGSNQLRQYRIARRDGATVATACVLSGISMGEARLIEAEAISILDYATDALGLTPPWRVQTPLVQQFRR